MPVVTGHGRGADAPVRGLFFFLGAELFVSAAFINYFCRAFDYSRALIPLHLSLVAGLMLLALALPAPLLVSRRLRRSRAVALVVALPLAILASALVVLYLADFTSNIEMAANITYKLVGIWVHDFRSGGNLLALSRSVIVSVLAGLAAVVAVHAWWAVTIRDALVSIGERAASSRRRMAAAMTLALVVVVGYAVYGWELARRTPYSELLASDPILAFPRQSIDVYDEAYVASTGRLRVSEPAVRASYPRDVPFDRRNVIVIIVDSLRADHMSIYGYYRPTTPFLASLEASGKLKKVDLALSACAESNCGILATMMSKPLRRQIAEDFKLHDLLHDQGYKTYFVLSGNHDWQNLRDMYGYEHTLYFDGRNATEHSRSDDRVLFEGLSKVPDRQGPAFFYFHLMSAHLIGIKQDRYRLYTPSDVENDWDALFAGKYDRETVVNNYDNGVTQADATIRELFDTLDRKGYLRGSLVVILADHGEALADRTQSGYGHITQLYQEFIRIPMLIYDDRGLEEPAVPFATQLDVAPTIVDRLGLPVPSSWEGTPLWKGPRPVVSFHQTALKMPSYAVTLRTETTTYKYIYSYLGRREEVYDLNADRGEHENLRDTIDPAILQRLRAELERFRSQ